jgi:hypothetical protein
MKKRGSPDKSETMRAVPKQYPMRIAKNGQAAEFSASIGSIRRKPTGGIQIDFSANSGEGRSGPVPPGFDPWADYEFSPMDIFSLMGTPMLAQWSAARCVTGLRPVIEAGQFDQILRAMTLIARHGLVMPEWLADAYLARYTLIERDEVGSLDDAFGHAFRSERKRDDNRRRRRQIPLVSALLVKAINKDPNRALDKSLYEEVGSKLGISGSSCDALYREGVRDHGMQDLVELKRLILNGVPPASPSE